MKIFNKKARFDYFFLETFEAGVVLSGAEVKSVRAGRVNLSDAFAKVQNGQVYLKNCYIYPWYGVDEKYDPRKDRKLLLHKKQIINLIGKIAGSSTTLVPVSIYTAHNLIKVEIALAGSKRKYDKKKAKKARDEQRRISQELS